MQLSPSLAISLALNALLLSVITRPWALARHIRPKRVGGSTGGTRGAVAILGTGKMGAGFVRRLRERGHGLVIWNRTPARAEALSQEELEGPCEVQESAAAAIEKIRPGGLVVVMLADIPAVRELLANMEVRRALRGRVLANMVSGNPDEGRELGLLAMGAEVGCSAYIDGMYSGSPTKAAQGAGQLFVSDDSGGAAVRQWEGVLKDLGSVTYSGGVGASRALDYAVVDLYFVNFLSFLSNAAMLEAEGVDLHLYAAEAAKRLTQVPAFVLASAERMKARDDNSYLHSPSAKCASTPRRRRPTAALRTRHPAPGTAAAGLVSRDACPTRGGQAAHLAQLLGLAAAVLCAALLPHPAAAARLRPARSGGRRLPGPARRRRRDAPAGGRQVRRRQVGGRRLGAPRRERSAATCAGVK